MQTSPSSPPPSATNGTICLLTAGAAWWVPQTTIHTSQTDIYTDPGEVIMEMIMASTDAPVIDTFKALEA